MRQIIAALLLALGLASLSGPALAAVCSPTPALPDTERRTEYPGIVAQTGPFNVGFQLYGDNTDYGNWAEVWVNGTKLTAITDYTVTSPSGALANLCRPISDAQVTFTAAQTGTIEIVGARRPRRASQVSENTGVTARAFNQVISDMEAQVRERWDFASRLLRSPPGETLSVMPTAATRAGKFLYFDNTGLAPQFTTGGAGTGNVVGPPSSTTGNIAAWDNATGTLLRDGGVLVPPITTVGAACNGATDDTTTIQTALNGGGWVVLPRSNCRITAPLIITKPTVLLCAAPADPTVAANIVQATTSADGIRVRSGYVWIGCSIEIAGSATGSATGIKIGDDAVSASGTFNGTTTLNCNTCTFTSADIGKNVAASTVGAAGAPLFTSIAAIIDTHNVTMALAATGTGTVTFGYGFNYQEVHIERSAIYNFVFGINVISATQYHINKNYVLGADPLTIQNIQWSDSGVGDISGNTFVGSVAGAHNVVNMLSGGAIRFDDNEVLAQAAISNCIQVAWSGTTSIGPWIRHNSIDGGGCTVGININGGLGLRAGIISGNHILSASGGTGIRANPSTAHDGWVIANNAILQAGGGNAILLSSNMTNIEVLGNNGQNIDGNGTGNFINIGATVSGVVRVGATSITNPIINASANTTLEVPNGIAFASLPAVAKNGSKIFVADATINSNPCAGGGSGAWADRINGAYVCGLASLPNDMPMLGDLLATNIVAPGSPAAGKTRIYADSTDKRLHDKNDAGTIGTTVVADTGAANNFLTAISAAGVITKAQPGFSNLSGTATYAQIQNVTASRLLGNPTGGAAAPSEISLAASLGFSGTSLTTGQFTGDVTTPTSGSVATTIANSAVTNAKMANMANGTIKCRTTAGTGAPEDCTAAQVGALFTKPTVQRFLSGSGTYTTPANVTWIEIEMQGAGGGGGGSGTTPPAATAGGDTCWNTSGAACTTPVYQAGGGALGPTNGNPGLGGTIAGTGTCNVMALAGGNGQAGTGSTNQTGGHGGVSHFGGNGWGGGPGSAGVAAQTNSGSGGGGAGDSATPNTGSGGGAGAYCRTIIGSPAATYTYATGAAGAAGTNGTGGFNGAAGGAGAIYVIEHYD